MEQDPYQVVPQLLGNLQENKMAKIDHLGIAVKSIEQARSFYEALGLAVLADEREEEGVRSVMVPLGDSQLRLLQPVSSNTELGKFLDQHGEGLHHLALHVDDISSTFEEMKQAGVKLLSDDIEIGAGGRLHFLVAPSAANGVLLEICQDPIAAV
jgi:methylmalonyl-CoA/ethylmalonyl-CoA epimerase